ncbi:alkaline phosphatase [Micromonospora echinospora]|uniref:PglZ domain-containing protein n=1 Tax=Micromonospora echinospora TaxID=1877 RepID=A0A1C4V5Y9_MICEC|nr:BREX-2 system phosphatase PglZ [Micromonospora echinospora]OZV83099.1 alkaline phosphatase [Micromonospora echinospora]SCE79231.1 PglZ domain-containing protein [Micromonospora echinospora]
MSAARAAVRPDAVRRKVEAWLAERDGTAALALAARPEWPAEPALTVDGVTVRVVPCLTPLAARAALHERADGERLVLLTELGDDELGDGLLAHLSKQRIRKIDAWDLVRQMFSGAALDPTLVRLGRWVADALADHVPPQGWSPPPGAIVTRDHALGCLTAELLGVPRAQLDDSGLLQWSTNAPAQRRFAGLPDPVAEGVTRYLVGTAGRTVAPILAAVRAGHGVDVIPVGLLAGVLWGPTTDQRVAVVTAAARARLEPRFGGVPPTPDQAAALHEAAEAWVYRTIDSGRDGREEATRLLHRAETIAEEIGVGALLGGSAVLPAGFGHRLRDFADAVRFAVPAGGVAVPALVAKAQQALATLEDHRAAEPERVTTARMAVRLLRWLTTSDDTPPATLREAVRRHAQQDGWVDRARLDVFTGDRDAAEAYRLLCQAVDARRARHDRQFATLLAEATAADAEPGALLRVEDVLDRVVQPILDHGQRVLLVVLDGMSVAAATEVAESLTENGSWLELTPDGGQREGVLAALPTVTEVSRCSLFSGRIATGGQAAERSAFSRRWPHGVLLHKTHLRAGAGATLDREIREALDDPAVPLVAAVVNTIDDALDRGEPGTAVWGGDTIPALRELVASVSDRVVVLLSDHGHVVDRGPDARVLAGAGGGNRWRPADEPATGLEATFTGSRVALGGGRIVLPWREDVRYGPRKAGYHGGASPAEAVIPLLVFSRGDDRAVPGWAGAPVASPHWWRELIIDGDTSAAGSGTTAPPPVATAPALGARRRVRPEAPQPDSLFELASDPATLPGVLGTNQARPDLVTALLSSERYAQRRDARLSLPDERVAAMLGTLLAGGGRATLETLAARAGVPAHRISGTVTVLRRLLQVEGYPVVTLDADRRTVHLDRDLLVEQFELDQP